MTGAAGFSLLYVCTANICRSPIAERLTTRALSQALGAEVATFRITSAGVRGWEGEPMHPEAARVLTARGADPAGFRARVLRSCLLEGADLVLTATRAHRAAVVALAPSTLSHCFTIREFAGLAIVAGSSPPAEDPEPADLVARARGRVDRARRLRGSRPPEAPDVDDLADPYGGPPYGYDTCADALVAAVGRTVALLTGGRPG